MPKITITNKQLLLIRNEINEYSKASITYALFNSEKIKRFFSYNLMRIQAADKRLNSLITAFVKHDDKDKPIKLEDEGGFAKYDFIDENAKKAFEVEYNDFMKKDITIEY